MDGIIIEGVAGTGKSTIVSLLKESSAFSKLRPSYEVVYEEQTTSELVEELRDQRLSDEDRYARLRHLMPFIRQQRDKGHFLVLERFHPTYFALMPQCSQYEALDQELASLNFGLILLDVPNSEFRNRSFSRPEKESENWSQALIEWYGSQDAAISAFTDSQERRRKFLEKTKLKNIRIDTSGRHWDSYIESIIQFIAE